MEFSDIPPPHSERGQNKLVTRPVTRLLGVCFGSYPLLPVVTRGYPTLWVTCAEGGIFVISPTSGNLGIIG